MTNYTCERCLKDFTQKSHYDKHINKKNPCQNNKIKVEKKAKELLKNTNIEEKNIDFKNIDGFSYLSTVKDNTIDLILTDPPYIISRESGMNTHYNNVKENEKNGIQTIKTEEEWEKDNNITNDDKKKKYMKYGSIYGKKYCVKKQKKIFFYKSIIFI
jgi:16S rRNA G966 N2-methylase RsmD